MLSMDAHNSNTTKSVKYSSVIISIVISLIVLAAIGMPIFQSQYIYPKFIEQLVENTESEAIRAGTHMMREVINEYSQGRLSFSDDLVAYFEAIGEDFGLWKIKVFDTSGETVYSTSKDDIGKFNENSYFHDVVAKGKPYTKVVQKDTRSLEGQLVNSDVVETYVPMMKEGEFIGAFELYYNITLQKSEMDELISQYSKILYVLTAILIAAVVLAAIFFLKGLKERRRYERAMLEKANTDPLTGVYNRRRFDEILHWEFERVKRYDLTASLLILDLDHFKKVNDTYGHQAGDDVLIATATKISESLRKSDILGRYGGEEFIALLPETDRENALKTAERLRRVIEASTVSYGVQDIKVTISVGVSYLSSEKDLTIEKIIKNADESLYSAKEKGRNQVAYIHPYRETV